MVLTHAAAMPLERRGPAQLAGALFLIAMAASLYGGALVDAAQPAPGFQGPIQSGGLLTGALMELINAFAVVGIGACLYPVLKAHGQSASLGYLCFRVVEAVFCALAALAPLMMIALGKLALAEESLRPLYALADSMRDGLVNLLIPLSFCAGAAISYGFYIIPAGPKVCFGLGNGWRGRDPRDELLTAFGATFAQQTMMALALPMILNEVFLVSG
jgi:threonine/homoserine/homoserine lactone efflux protein